MSFFSRWADKWIGSLETRNPEAVYESAIKQQREAIVRNKDVFTSCIVRRNRLSNELEELERALRQVMVDLPAAIDNGDDETALVMIQRKDDLVTKLETLTTHLDQAKEDVATAKTAVELTKQNLDTLTREKTQAIAELRVAQARIAVQNANDAFSDDPGARGLTSVRESIERLDSQAHGGALDSEGRAKVRAHEKRSAELQARAELNRLKAAHGAPKSGEAGDESGEESEDDAKQRSL
ncbi:MAG: hypothetical protein HN348_20115 [Proteobacteria bacterium]|nr:hypothetical protein [Pseudomonadota bacterium]